MKRTLIQFAKAPVPGKVKTRLMERYSAEEAAQWHCRLTMHTWQQLLSVSADSRQLWVSGDWQRNRPAHSWFKQDSFSEAHFIQQPEGDLGYKMTYALRQGKKDSDYVLLAGSDCPVLTSDILESAFDCLRQPDNDLVLIPAEDGGFVLIGCSIMLSENTLDNLSWGHDRVLQNTLQRLREQQLSYTLLPALWDVDHPEDTDRWLKQIKDE